MQSNTGDLLKIGNEPMGLRDLSLTRALTTPPRRLLGPPSWVSNAVYALAARGAAQSVVEKDDANTRPTQVVLFQNDR